MRKSFILILMVIATISAIKSIADETQRHDPLRELNERAEAGDGKALYNLATVYENGYDSIAPDTARSVKLYQLSARAGYAPAQNYLGFLYFNGNGIKQDIDSALYWMAKAAGNGDAKAANNLGYLLAHSEVVTRDYPQAVSWLTKAAEAGLPSAQANLAELVSQGLGTETDTIKAASLYDKAIEGGLSDAGFKLIALMGEKWEKLPADTLMPLGRQYYLGRAPFVGVTIFDIAAEKGSVDALALLGDAYSKGLGVEYDHDRSLNYFLTAALADQPSAQFVIGELIDMFPDALDNEESLALIKQEVAEDTQDRAIYDARYWYEKAALQGVTNAEIASRLLLGI